MCEALGRSMPNIQTQPVARFTMIHTCRIPRSKLSIQVACMPGLRGISRMLTGMAILPSLSDSKRNCPWSALFKSSKVPRASLFASASGKIVCEDAIHEVQQQGAAQAFPWRRSTWPELLHDAIMRHPNNLGRGMLRAHGVSLMPGITSSLQLGALLNSTSVVLIREQMWLHITYLIWCM